MLKKKLSSFIFRFFFYRNNKIHLKKGIVRAFKLQSEIERYINRLVVSYYDGKHPKHFLWKNHYQFIIENINPHDKIIDIGCGSSLSYNQQLADKIDFLDAIDIDQKIIDKCLKLNQYDNIHYNVLDITKKFPLKHYDVAILSHILEHLDNPEDLLRRIRKITSKIIVRLPRYDDHWWYLVKKDLGLFYYKSRDHRREYTIKSAIKLIESTDWNITKSLNDVDIKIVAIINNEI